MNTLLAFHMNKSRNKMHVAILMVSISIFVLIAWLMSRSLDDDLEAANFARTHAMLTLCENALKAWIIENGRIPTESEGISVLALKKIPLDAWGHVPLLKWKAKALSPQYYLYLAGPNGVDENGVGDDIRL